MQNIGVLFCRANLFIPFSTKAFADLIGIFTKGLNKNFLLKKKKPWLTFDKIIKNYDN